MLELIDNPFGITAAPSNLACRLVAIKGKFVQIVFAGRLGTHVGGCISMLRPRKSNLGSFGSISEFRRLYERVLEVHLRALEIQFGAVAYYF